MTAEMPRGPRQTSIRKYAVFENDVVVSRHRIEIGTELRNKRIYSTALEQMVSLSRFLHF